MNYNRAQIRQLHRDNAQWPTKLAAIPFSDWPPDRAGNQKRFSVMRSRDFLVQLFEEIGGIIRLSINRTDWDRAKGRFREGISWDEMQRLKAEAGYAMRDAVEVFPADADVVNVANMRHLWILPAPLPFAWRGRK